MSFRHSFALAALFVCLVAVSCDDDPSSGQDPDGSTIDSDGGIDLTLDLPDDLDAVGDPDSAEDIVPDITGPVVTVVVEGSLEDRAPDDDLASQTPDPYYYGLQRLELLRNADDSSPEVIFDYAPDALLVDMHERTEVARVAIESLPTDTFTHARFVLTILEAEVVTTLHQVPVVDTLTTPLHIVYALSDVTIDGVTLNQGDALATVSFAGTTATMPGHWDVVYPEPGPGGWIESVDNVTLITFMLPEPLNVIPGSSEDLVYGMRFFIKDSFRWQDQDEADYTVNEWDATIATPPSIEPVLRFGANDIEIFAE